MEEVTSNSRRSEICALVVAICAVCSAAARGQTIAQAEFLSVVGDMVTQQAPRSVYDAAMIRDAYQPYVDPLVLDNFGAIEAGLANAGLVRLPFDPERFNVRVRLDGANPIGEKDALHQSSYIAARPATIGCLLDVASRVKSGPIEVTSLVRHLEYQQQLRLTNANATTDLPTHALGIAFDIAMVNTPLPTVLQIRDVLQQMSDAGDVFVIVERQQLVFHVVPQPARLGWYAEVYARAITGQPWTRPAADGGSLTPVVTAAIGSVRPLPAWAAEWWAAENVPADLPVVVHAGTDSSIDAGPLRLVSRYFAWVGDLVSTTWPQKLLWTIPRPIEHQAGTN